MKHHALLLFFGWMLASCSFISFFMVPLHTEACGCETTNQWTLVGLHEKEQILLIYQTSVYDEHDGISEKEKKKIGQIYIEFQEWTLTEKLLKTHIILSEKDYLHATTRKIQQTRNERSNQLKKQLEKRGFRWITVHPIKMDEKKKTYTIPGHLLQLKTIDSIKSKCDDENLFGCSMDLVVQFKDKIYLLGEQFLSVIYPGNLYRIAEVTWFQGYVIFFIEGLCDNKHIKTFSIKDIYEVIQQNRVVEQKRNIKKSSKQKISRVLRKLRHHNWRKRLEATKQLKQMGKRGASTIPDLIRALYDAHFPVRTSAADALVAMGSMAIEPLSRELSQSSDWKVRMYCAKALGMIGSDAKVALPNLEKALKDSHETVRKHAQISLQQIRGK